MSKTTLFKKWRQQDEVVKIVKAYTGFYLSDDVLKDFINEMREATKRKYK